MMKTSQGLRSEMLGEMKEPTMMMMMVCEGSEEERTHTGSQSEFQSHPQDYPWCLSSLQECGSSLKLRVVCVCVCKPV